MSLINQRLMKIAEFHRLENRSNIETAINSLKPPVLERQAHTIQVKKWNLKKINEILKNL